MEVHPVEDSGSSVHPFSLHSFGTAARFLRPIFFTLERMGTALVTTDFTTGLVMGGDSECSRSMGLRLILSSGGNGCMFSMAALAGRLLSCCMAVDEMACAEVERWPVGKTLEQNGLSRKGDTRSIETARGSSSSA